MVSDKTYKLIFWCAVLIVLLLSLLPISAPELELFQWQDKFHHFMTYSGLCFFGIQAYGQNHSVWVIGSILVLFGLVIELAQSLTGYRFVDPIDLAANTLGIIVAGVFLHKQRNKL
jgi:VanZ family protein